MNLKRIFIFKKFQPTSLQIDTLLLQIMNDSISVSSSSFSNNSSNNSKSSSLNRTEVQSNNNHATKNDFLDRLESNISNLQIDPNNNNIMNSNESTNCASHKSKRSHTTSRLIDSYSLLSPRKHSLPLSSMRRRAKSQILFNGDSLNTLADQNALLMEDLYSLKKQLKRKDATIVELNEIRDRLESEMHELSASLFEVIDFVGADWKQHDVRCA